VKRPGKPPLNKLPFRLVLGKLAGIGGLMLRNLIVLTLLLLAGPLSQAKPNETKAQVFAVKGMHCEACVSSIRKKICTEGTYSACDVALTDEKKQLGEIRITPKEGQTIDLPKMRTQVSDMGYELKN
jgi:copper chaperone CopZ